MTGWTCTQKVKICHQSDSSEDDHVCKLKDMPNWAYSYALALYRKSHWEEDAEEIRQKANEALDLALSQFPLIPRLLLEKNKINVKVRSFQTDWSSVMDPLEQIDKSTNAGVEKISSIFAERNYKLWSGDDVLKWLYDGCQRLATKSLNEESETGEMPFALIRYLEFDPIDFQDSFRRIPADANPLDPGLMDAALHYTPNRRRFLRVNRRQGRGEGEGIDLDMVRRQQPQTLLGTGRNGMEVLDPDLPLMELFLRSFLPWARVDGVPPAPAP